MPDTFGYRKFYAQTMNRRIFTQLFLLAVILLQVQNGFAFETDQYNLSPQPLADIGNEVSDYAEETLRLSVEKVNAEILRRENCSANRAKDCDSVEQNEKRLAYLRSNDAVAREVYKILGGGIVPFTNSGSWLESHRFNAQPARFKTSFGDSLFVRFPTSYFGLASTVKMFDAEFGTDKIAHLFQEGYGYFKEYNKSINKGLSVNQATVKAVKSGQKTERGIYGTWVSGVYSNGDLAANYVGLKFYQGLTVDLGIGDKVRPAVLKLKDGKWIFNENFEMSQMLLKPFISDHLNEALNPSVFTKLFGLNSTVRNILKNRACGQWIYRFPDRLQADYERDTEALKRWNNEDYGFTESDKFITIADTCFGEEPKKL
jgi:hypothetical protein